MLKIRKGYETKVKSYEIKMFCECGGILKPTMTQIKGNDVHYSLSCTDCNKSTSANLKFNEYELFEDEDYQSKEKE